MANSRSNVRLLHIGDTHLGPGPRAEEKRAIVRRIIDYGLTLPDLGAWLWPGDLNHGKMTIEDRNFLAVELQRMADHAPVIICYGNHDTPGDLDVFAKLEARWSIIVVSAADVISAVAAPNRERMMIGVLPYPTKGALVEGQDTYQDGQSVLDALLSSMAVDLRQSERRGEMAIMIGHVNVAGSQASNGQPQIGRELEVAPRSLEPYDGLYIGLNHIHKAQTIAGASYAGSICRLDWGEVDPKSITLITYVNRDDGRWSHVAERVPIDVAPMVHIEGALTRDGWQPDANQDHQSERSVKGCEVRARYRFLASERAVLSEAPILAAYADASRLVLDPVAIPDRSVRAPQIAASASLVEKLEAWCAMNGREFSSTLAAKLETLASEVTR